MEQGYPCFSGTARGRLQEVPVWKRRAYWPKNEKHRGRLMIYELIPWDEDYMWSLTYATNLGPPIDPIKHFNDYTRDRKGALIKKAAVAA